MEDFDIALTYDIFVIYLILAASFSLFTKKLKNTYGINAFRIAMATSAIGNILIGYTPVVQSVSVLLVAKLFILTCDFILIKGIVNFHRMLLPKAMERFIVFVAVATFTALLFSMLLPLPKVMIVFFSLLSSIILNAVAAYLIYKALIPVIRSIYYWIFFSLITIVSTEIAHVVFLIKDYSYLNDPDKLFIDIHFLILKELLFIELFILFIGIIFLLYRHLELRLELEAERDHLTGAYNRRALNKYLNEELIRSKKHTTPFSILFLDIDHFKQINDRYGHDIGDLALKELVQVINQHLQPYHSIGRYGGEEFVVILPGCTIDEASEIAQSIRSSVETNTIPSYDTMIHYTVSIGVTAAYSTDSTDSLLKRSDDAM